MSTVRDIAAIRLPSGPVKSRRPRRTTPRTTTTAVDTHALTVDPRVMEAALAAMHPGQRLVIVSETCVRLVNKR